MACSFQIKRWLLISIVPRLHVWINIVLFVDITNGGGIVQFVWLHRQYMYICYSLRVKIKTRNQPVTTTPSSEMLGLAPTHTCYRPTPLIELLSWQYSQSQLFMICWAQDMLDRVSHVSWTCIPKLQGSAGIPKLDSSVMSRQTE